MRLRNGLALFVFIFNIFLSLPSGSSAQDLDLSGMMGQVSPSSRFRLDSFMVWCGSMVTGPDNRYYLFYSRWPRALGHLAWATHSEVAVAVADHPTGPYTHLSVVLPKRDKKYWDADVTHNPTIHKFGDTYYLYYMGNHGNGEWWDHRNHQRIGVATAKHPAGPWSRTARPLIDTTTGGFDHMIASNPSVLKRPDGQYQIIYKGVSPGPLPFGGVVTHGAALSDRPEGPFKKTSHKIFIKDSVKFAAEDPYIWYQQGKYWAIVKDMQGVFTHRGTSLALFESPDGFDWKVAIHTLVSTTQIPWTTGLKKVQKLERPQLWFKDGQPAVLFCAVYDGDDNYNVAIPLIPEPGTISGPGKEYELLYAEHFPGDTLNLKDWQYRTGRRTGMGYMDGLNLPQNVYVRDSALYISVKHEMIDGKWENTGGGIISRHNFGYGYYETLSKPFMEGHGVHTSFWQRGGAQPNNNIFEIDSYEIDSKTWVATNNLYVDLPFRQYGYTPWPHRAQVPFQLKQDGWFLDAYEFTPEGVIFYDHGKEVARAEYPQLNAHQVVWLTALNGVGKVDSTRLPGASVFKYFKYYGRDYPGVTILPNGHFEFNQSKYDPLKPLCWTNHGSAGAVKVVSDNPSSDHHVLRIGSDTVYDASISQSLEFIMNGRYQLTARVRSSARPGKSVIRVSGFGGDDIVYALPSSGRWTDLRLPDVDVLNHQVRIEASARGDAGEWIEIDDIMFMKPSKRGQVPVPPVRSASANDPMWALAEGREINFSGDQKFYFFDRNVGFGDSISISMDITAGMLANMTPVARIPQTGNSGWSIQLTQTGGVVFRIGSMSDHTELMADSVYELGKPVHLDLVFLKGTASIWKNGRLIGQRTGITHETRDATAAGRVGTVGKAFEAVGEVVMQVGKAEDDRAGMKNFRGSIRHLRIYNRGIHPMVVE
jgi:hypothetical protein